MTRYLLIIWTAFLGLTASCGQQSKQNKIVSEKQDSISTDRHPVLQSDFYKGDTSLTISFAFYLDSANFIIKDSCEEIIKTKKEREYTLINVYGCFTAGQYNGSCEKRNDTLVAYYWQTGINNVSEMTKSMISYKIKNTDFRYVKLEYANQ